MSTKTKTKTNTKPKVKAAKAKTSNERGRVRPERSESEALVLKAKAKAQTTKTKVAAAKAKTKTKAKTKAKTKVKAKRKRKQQPRKWPKIAKKEFDRFHVDMPVPTNGVRTSKQAAESIKDDTSRLRRLVWTTIYLHNGLICDEVEVITNLKHQTASARIYELHQRGWLVDSGYRRRTRGRCLAIVWIPPKRLKMLRRLVKQKKVKVATSVAACGPSAKSEERGASLGSKKGKVTP